MERANAAAPQRLGLSCINLENSQGGGSMSKTTRNIKTMELSLWAKTDLFVCPLFLIVMFIFFSGKNTIYSVDLQRGEEIECVNTVFFGISVANSINRGESYFFSRWVDEYQLNTSKYPLVIWRATTWENMLGHKVFNDGYTGSLDSAILEQFERVKNSADKNASPDYTDIFYEVLSDYSDRLKISNKPFYDDGVKSNRSILSEIIKERNASRRREVESTDASNKLK